MKEGGVVEKVESFKFLGVHITDNLGLSPKTFTTFTDEQLRASCRAVSPPGITTAPPTTARISSVVRLAQRITGGKLPALQDIYSTLCHRKVNKIIKDISHPSHGLLTPLPSRRRDQYRFNQRCLKAIKLLNSHY